MSVLKSIKGALDTVQSDISESFKALSSKVPKAKKKENKVKVDGVDLDAGADLLNKFQQKWEQIHIESEENAKRAQDVDTEITSLFVRCEHQNDSMNHLLALVAGLPQLLNDVNQLTLKLEHLETEFKDAHTKLVEFEDLSNASELAANSKHHKQQLHLYKQRKNLELEQFKVKQAQHHAEKVQAYEAKLQAKIQERQQVFEDTFKEEILNYKLYGTTVLKPQLSESASEDLANITLDEDNLDDKALDDFLKSDDESDNNEKLKDAKKGGT